MVVALAGVAIVGQRCPMTTFVGAMSYQGGQRLPFCDEHVTRDGGRTWTRERSE